MERIREDFERERKLNKELREKMEKEKVRNRSVIYCDIRESDQYATTFDHSIVTRVSITKNDSGSWWMTLSNPYKINADVLEACTLQFIGCNGFSLDFSCSSAGRFYKECTFDLITRIKIL